MQEALSRTLNGVSVARRALAPVLAEPRAHPRESMLLALIAAAAVLLLVLGGMLVVDVLVESRRRVRLGVRARRQLTAGKLAMPVVLPAILFIVLAQLPALSWPSQLCGSCHPVRHRVASWASSSHREVGCFGCHADASVIGRTEELVEELGRWAVRGGEKSVWPVQESACLRCHGDVRRRLTVGRVRMQHSDVIDAGIDCVECHDSVGHKVTAKKVAEIRRRPMTTCLVCHDGERAPSRCNVCHLTRPSDQASRPAPGAAEITVKCTDGCHKGSSKCLGCHGLEMPHPENFKREHAARSALNPEVCTQCHAQATRSMSCSCHADGAIHGNVSQWFVVHGSTAAASGPGGCRCHDNARFAMCLKCHDTLPW